MKQTRNLADDNLFGGLRVNENEARDYGRYQMFINNFVWVGGAPYYNLSQ